MNHALVTGANGLLGTLLLETLARQGVRTRAFVRQSVTPVHADSIALGDITDGDAVRRAVEGTDVVFHLAARLHRAMPTDDDRRVNVGGTAAVCAAAAAAGSKVIFFSTINVYGPTDQHIADEQSACNPRDLYGMTKLEAETIVRGGERNVILRMAAVYGRRMKGNYPRLVKAIRKGRFVHIGSGENRRTVIHEWDAIDAAILAARSPAASGQTFNVTDGEVHTVREIIAAISEAAGRGIPRVAVPVFPFRLAAVAIDGVMSLVGRSPRYRPLIEKYREDIAVSGEKIQRTIGFRPHIDLRTGWKLALAPHA